MRFDLIGMEKFILSLHKNEDEQPFKLMGTSKEKNRKAHRKTQRRVINVTSSSNFF